MVPFAGYDMPVAYPAGILAEHRQCRESAALFDVSHMGQLRLVGDGAARGARIAGAGRRGRPRRSASSATRFFTNAAGGILDDLMVTRRDRRPVPGRQRRAARTPTSRHLRHAHRPPLHGRAAARPRAARAAGPEGGAARWPRLHPSVAAPHVHDRRQRHARRRRLLRHALGLHRRRRLRDLGAGRQRRGAGAGAAGAARGQAGRPRRARHAAPRSGPVPVRPRHRRDAPRRSRPA